MNPSISFWRLAWKEYRTQRSLWVAVLVLTGVVQLVVTLIAALGHDGPIPAAGYLVMVFVAVGVYMLGCGATLFALEHEHGTFDFQRLLPAPAWQIYLSKLGVGFLSGVVLLAVLLVSDHAFFVGWHAVLSSTDWLAGWIAFTEVFVWSVLFSLVLRHPLRAAVCGIVAMTVTVCIILPLTTALTWEHEAFIYHRSFLGTRIVIIGLLLAVDTWLTWRWFDGKIGLPSAWKARTRRVADTWLVPAGPVPVYIDARPIGWWRLVGITWRQGKWVMLLLCGLFLWSFVRPLTAGTAPRSSDLSFVGLPAVLCAIVFGLCTFTLDQWSHQFRFFAERGVSPRWLWFSRQVVWSTPVILQAVCVQWLAFQLKPAHSPIDEYLTYFGWLIAAATIFGLSQLCGMFIRSTLVALVVSFFAALMGWCWALLMLTGNIPLWWSVLPIPIMTMVATWWFSKDWIEERHDRRHWTQVALMLGIPTILILFGCTVHRAFEIPQVDPGFSVVDYTRPLNSSEQETLRIYEEADRILAQGVWLEAASPALSLLERAHERVPVPLTLIKGPSSRTSKPAAEFLGSGNPVGFFLLLRMQAESLTRENKLSEAWRCYEIGFELLRRFRLRATGIYAMQANSEERDLLESVVRWSAHPQQTEDRIRVALAKLEGLDSQESDGQREAKIRNVFWREFLDGKQVDPSALGLTPREAPSISWACTLMPWERTRSRRLHDAFTLAMLDPQGAMRQLESVPQPVRTMWAEVNLIPIGRFAMQPFSPMHLRRRATQVLVALVYWQRGHAELPKSLNELVPTYFRQLPLDPIVAKPFDYFPNGIPVGFVARPLIAAEPPVPWEIQPNTPFLWSPLMTGTEIVLGSDGKFQGQSRGVSIKLEESLEQGLPWRIPLVTEKEEE